MDPPAVPLGSLSPVALSVQAPPPFGALVAAFAGSSLTLTASLATLRVQVTNGGVLANDLAVFVEIYGYHP